MIGTDAVNTPVAFISRSPGVNSWECSQVLVYRQNALQTRALNGVPGDFSTPIAGFWGPKWGTHSRLLPFRFLKSGICRILGAHKPHRRDKAVPHRWGTQSTNNRENRSAPWVSNQSAERNCPYERWWLCDSACHFVHRIVALSYSFSSMWFAHSQQTMLVARRSFCRIQVPLSPSVTISACTSRSVIEITRNATTIMHSLQNSSAFDLMLVVHLLHSMFSPLCSKVRGLVTSCNCWSAIKAIELYHTCIICHRITADLSGCSLHWQFTRSEWQERLTQWLTRLIYYSKF